MLKLENYLGQDQHGLQKFDIRMSDKHHFIKRIPWIVYYNAMVIEQNVELLCYDRLFSDYCGDGLYIKSSFFNHDCTPNCIRIFIGDICIVRAIKDIKAKEECCFSYIANEYLCENYRLRNYQLPFECLCSKCIEQRTQYANETNANDKEKENNTNNNNTNNRNNSSASSMDDNNRNSSTIDECKDSNTSQSRERIESDYDSEAEGEEMINYQEHRIFTNEIASKLFEITNAQERIYEINKLLGIINNDTMNNKSMKEIEFSIKNRSELNFSNNNNNNNNNNTTNKIVHRDFLEAYTAKAMSYLAIGEWELANYSWQMCASDVRNVQGCYNENVIVYDVQCLLCCLAMGNDNNNTNSSNDVEKLMAKQKELLENILHVHHVCFGSDIRLFRMRYDVEIGSSHYPQQVKEMFWPFVEKNI